MATIEKSLEQARIALHNASSEPQVLATLTIYGYGIERLQEGMALYEAARVAVEIKISAQFNKLNATEGFQQSWKEAQLHYKHDLNAARLALKPGGANRSLLQLAGRRPKAFDGWHAQARNFYFGLRNQPELQAAIAKMGLTAERINQGIQSLETLDAARSQQHAQKGNAGNMYNQRNQAFQALQRWMLTFRQVARAAFANNPVNLATLALSPTPRKTKKHTALIKFEIPALDTANLLTMSR